MGAHFLDSEVNKEAQHMESNDKSDLGKKGD